MKISKARLQQIIKEEVENHLRETEGILEFDEASLSEVSNEKKDDKEQKKKTGSHSQLDYYGKHGDFPDDDDEEENPGGLVDKDTFLEKKRDTKEDQLHQKDSKKVIPPKTEIKVELKNC